MRTADRSLVLASLLALAGAACAFLPLPSFARLTALPLALFLPGYAWLRAVAPQLRGSGERLTLATGLSLACSVLAGLALNALGRLDPQGWACALAGVTLAGAAVAAWRRGADEEPAPSFRPSVAQAAILACSLGVAGFAVSVAARSLDEHREYRFTELWMTPHGQYDRSLVTIGVRNDEAEPTDYTISVVSHGAVVGRWPAIRLDPGATWSTDFALSGDLLKSRVEAWLYKADAPNEIYRKVWMSPVTSTAVR